MGSSPLLGFCVPARSLQKQRCPTVAAQLSGQPHGWAQVSSASLAFRETYLTSLNRDVPSGDETGDENQVFLGSLGGWKTTMPAALT